MPSTIGHYEYKIDPKNRLVVPPRYREALIAEKGSEFILTVGTDGCIGFFLPSQWERYLNKLDSQAIADKGAARHLRRYIHDRAVPAHLDEQGRILIPPHLKEHGKLKKDVVISGAGDKAEIWDLARFNAYTRAQAAPSYEKLTKNLDL